MGKRTVRDELQRVMDEIDTLNFRKAPLQRAWEAVRNDPEEPKPADLKAINRQLYEMYARRDHLLKTHPELQKEFGGGCKGRKRELPPSFGFQTKSQRNEEDRARRKKLILPGFREWCMAQNPPVKFSLDNWEDDGIRGMFRADQESKARSSAEAEAARRAKLEAIPRDFPFFLAEMGEPSATDDDDLIAAYEDGDTKELYDLWSLDRA